ncbi:MAG: glycosyltransferase family 39 protein [Candidatus Omnitrophica bacterium]|nr:glycosyltransferase family 39 protein [Candidatus Omnitrophota bacterium]
MTVAPISLKMPRLSFAMVLGMLLTLMYVVFLNPYIDVRGFNAHDPAGYIDRAISIWNGDGYGERFADRFLPVTMQPPGFSFLLAPIVGIFGVNFFALKIYMVFWGALTAFVYLFFFRRFLQRATDAYVATLVLMASPVIFGLSHRVLSEIPLFFFTSLALVALNNYLKSRARIYSGWLWMGAASLGIAYLFKFTALGVVAGGWLLFLHPEFRNWIVFKKMLLFTVLISLPVVLWQVYSSSIPQETWYWTNSFLNQFILKNPYDPASPIASVSDWVVRMRQNIVWGISCNIATSLIAPLYFLEGGFAGFFLSLPVVLWLAYQWLRSYRNLPSVLEGFTLFILVILVTTYEGQANRYIAILYPALVVYGFRGVSSSRFGISSHGVIGAILFLSTLTTFLGALDQNKNPYGSKTLRDFVQIAQKTKEMVSRESTCIAPLTSHWQILTGHSCFSSWKGAEADYYVVLSNRYAGNVEALQDIEKDAAKGAWRISDMLRETSSPLLRLYENDTFAIVRRS